MVKMKYFKKWANANGYSIEKQANDWAIIGVEGNGRKEPIGLGNHANDRIPDRVILEIAYRFGKTKAEMESEINEY